MLLRCVIAHSIALIYCYRSRRRPGYGRDPAPNAKNELCNVDESTKMRATFTPTVAQPRQLRATFTLTVAQPRQHL
jgi:hypothetical protein